MTTSEHELIGLSAVALTDPRSAPPAVAVLEALLDRIAAVDPLLASVLELDKTVVQQAAALDAERAAGRLRGPLHGVPFLVKANLDIGPDVPLRTTAGSAALVDASGPAADAPALARLRAAGALLVGTANLSEWANFRSTESSSGWSALGGQCRNPHVLDRSPGGSSSGSAAAVAALLAPFALGTETDGSILCPASLCGVVGMKPTLGLVPADGIIPIAASQDVAGPITRTVADAALVLGVLAPALGSPALSPDALRGSRIGVGRAVFCGYDASADAALEAALTVLSQLGATIIDPADVTSAAALRDGNDELTVLLCEFRDDLAGYLAGRPGGPADLEEVMSWNEAHADMELAHFGQDILVRAAATGGRADPAYRAARENCLRLARTEGLDATLARHDLDALVWPTYPVAWRIGLGHGGDGKIDGAGSTPTAVAGYPAITVPSGMFGGLPTGIMFAGPAGSDARLLSYAHAYERGARHRVDPAFLPTTG